MEFACHDEGAVWAGIAALVHQVPGAHVVHEHGPAHRVDGTLGTGVDPQVTITTLLHLRHH